MKEAVDVPVKVPIILTVKVIKQPLCTSPAGEWRGPTWYLPSNIFSFVCQFHPSSMHCYKAYVYHALFIAYVLFTPPRLTWQQRLKAEGNEREKEKMLYVGTIVTMLIFCHRPQKGTATLLSFLTHFGTNILANYLSITSSPFQTILSLSTSLVQNNLPEICNF